MQTRIPKEIQKEIPTLKFDRPETSPLAVDIAPRPMRRVIAGFLFVRKNENDVPIKYNIKVTIKVVSIY